MGPERSSTAAIAGALRDVFPRFRVLVVGDLMLDRYLWGDVARISPEAPVPIVESEAEDARPGGAGNVVLNLAGLGLEPSVAGFVGDDEAGERLLALVAAAGLDAEGVVTLPGQTTTTKTRILAGHQQVLRIDGPDPANIDAAARRRLEEHVEGALESGPAALILSDYAKGTLPPETCRRLIAAARAAGVPAFVDPKGRDFAHYAGATAVTPNRRELGLAAGVPPADREALTEAGRRMVEALGLEFMVLTLGAEGMSYLRADDALHRAAVAREVFDVSGAGDTAVAAIAAGHAAGLAPADLLHLANVAAGIVVGKVGTAAVQGEAVLEALRREGRTPLDSVYTTDELRAMVAAWRAEGARIVFTNGCFDILHVGHVAYLQRAAAAGDRLIVAVNTDRSVREVKGESRPVNAEEDRACVVAALAAVDAVVLFDEPTPLELIQALRPDVLVKGGDYAKDEVVGAADVESWGGEVILVPLVEGRSTSAVIRKIAG